MNDKVRGILRAIGRTVRRHRVVSSLVVVVLFASAALGGYGFYLQSRISRFDVVLHRSRPGGETFLIVGSDSRQRLPASERAEFGNTPGARTDILLAVRIPSDGSTPVVVSIPRDLLVVASDYGLHRLGLEWLGGPQTLVDTLCRSLGLGVDHVVSFDLEGFKSLVDAVGGIDIDLRMPIRDSLIDLSLSSGKQHLTGTTALQYVRARHLEELTYVGWVPLPNGRGEQAQTVLIDVARKLRVFNPLRLNRLVEVMTKAVAVDRSVGLRDMWDLVGSVRRLGSAQRLQVPAKLTNGAIPYAELTPAAGIVLAQAGSGGPACPTAALPNARVVSVRQK